jgi:6,7-dimethyl-8-ribityllumazine synthase
MATRNPSDFSEAEILSAAGMRFGIVVSQWNREITGLLEEGARNSLLKYGASESNITIIHVPGSFELPSGALILAGKGGFDAFILLGCVIRGETSHYDYVCQGVTQGTMTLNMKYGIPFIFGVLTTENKQQALDRAGGKYGNKGEEAAIAAIRMVSLKKKAQ